jgi:hypothetical protein
MVDHIPVDTGARRRVYVPTPDVRSKKWWQKCDVTYFINMLQTLSFDDLNRLGDEMDAAIAVTHRVMENSDDLDQRKRARIALGFMVEKRKFLKRAKRDKHDKNVDAHNERKKRRLALRDEHIDQARRLVEEDKLKEALVEVLDILQGDIYKDD